MTFKFTVSIDFRKKLDKLAHRDKTLAIAIRKKMSQIVACDDISVNNYKNLR